MYAIYCSRALSSTIIYTMYCIFYLCLCDPRQRRLLVVTCHQSMPTTGDWRMMPTMRCRPCMNNPCSSLFQLVLSETGRGRCGCTTIMPWANRQRSLPTGLLSHQVLMSDEWSEGAPSVLGFLINGQWTTTAVPSYTHITIYRLSVITHL